MHSCQSLGCNKKGIFNYPVWSKYYNNYYRCFYHKLIGMEIIVSAEYICSKRNCNIIVNGQALCHKHNNVLKCKKRFNLYDFLENGFVNHPEANLM